MSGVAFAGAIVAITASAQAANVKAVRIGASEARARIVFDLDAAAAHEEALSADKDRLSVVLSGATAVGTLIASPIGLVAAVEKSADVALTRFEFRLAERGRIARTLLIPPNADSANYRLMIDIASSPDAPEAFQISSAEMAPDADAAPAEIPQSDRCAQVRLDRTPSRSAGAPLADPYRCDRQPEISWKGPNRVEVDYSPSNLALTQTQRLGGDVVFPVKHLYAASLDPTRSWRSEVDGAVSLTDSDAVDVKLSFGLFDMERPIAYARGGVGAERFNTWRSNAVSDTAISVSAFDGRLSAAAGASYAETGLRQRTEAEPWLWVFEDPRRPDKLDRAEAAFARLGFEVGDNAASAKFAFAYSTTGEGYRSYQSQTIDDILYEGNALSLQSDFRLGGSKLRIDHEAVDGPVISFDTTRFRISRGAVTLKARVSDDRAQDAGLLLGDDRTVGGDVTLDLSKLLPAGLAGVLPDEIRLGYSERSANGATAFNSDAARRNSIGLGLRKEGEHFSTDIYVFKNVRDDLSELADFRTASQYGADINQSFFGDSWDFSLYANMSDLKRERRFFVDGAERVVSGGASFTKKFEKIPTMRVAFDAFQYSADYVSSDYAFQNHDLSVRLEADISEMLLTGKHQPVDRARPLGLWLAAYHGWSTFADSDATADSEVETRLMLLLRKTN